MTAPAPERLADLLASVEMAEGPSRELDADLSVLFLADRNTKNFNNWLWIKPKGGNHTIRDYFMEMAPKFTGSVDAALALVERVLPGLGMVMCRLSGSGLIQVREAFVFDEETDIEIEPEEHWRARPPALAILACLLRALISGAHHAD